MNATRAKDVAKQAEVGERVGTTEEPGLRLWACGFGEPAQSKLWELISQAKADDPMAPVTVITTASSGGALSLQRRLTAIAGLKGYGGLIGVAVRSLSDVAQDIANVDPVWAGQRNADDFVLGGAVREVLADETGLFASVKDHPSTELSLLRVVKELSDLNEPQLKQVEKRSQRAKAVVGLYRQTVEALAEHNLYLRAQVLRQAAEQIRSGVADTGVESPESANADIAKQIAELGTVVLYLPVDLKSSQLDFVKALAERTAINVISGLTGDSAADKLHLKLCEQLGVEALMEGGTVNQPPVGHQIVSVSDPDDEVRWVVRSVLSDLVSGVPASQIAIYYPVTSPYARSLVEQLNSVGIDWNGRGTHTLAESMVGRFALGLVELIGTGSTTESIDRAQLFRLLSSAEVVANASGRAQRLEPSAWERIAREARVVKADDWGARLSQRVDELRFEQESLDPEAAPSKLRGLKYDIAQCLSLKEFVAELGEHLMAAQAASTWRELSEWLQSALRRYLGTQPDIDGSARLGRWSDRWDPWQQAASVRVAKAVAGLIELEAIEPKVTFDVMRVALFELLTQPTSHNAGSGNGVFIGLLDAGMDRLATKVYVLGMAEGVCPSRRRPDSMITEWERLALDGMLDTATDHIANQQQALLAILASAESQGGHATLLYPRGNLRSKSENVPSRWLLETAQTLAAEGKSDRESELFGSGYLDEENLSAAARDTSIPAVTSSASFISGMLTTSFPTTAQEFQASELLRSFGHLARPVDEVLASPACESGSALELGVRLTKARRSPEFTRFDGYLGAVKNEAGEPLLRELVFSQPISPSALETWVRCPRAFLFERLLGVRPIEEPVDDLRITPLQLGALMHSVIDTFLREKIETGEHPGPSNTYTDEDRGQLNALASEALDELFSKGLGGHPLYEQPQRQSITNDISQFLEQDRNKSTHRGEVIASEYRFGFNDSAPAVEYEIPEFGTLLFRGVIDRVELLHKNDSAHLSVVDYKTGRYNSGQKYSYKQLNNKNPTVDGRKIQIAVYAIAAAKSFQSEHSLEADWQAAVAEAGYWFITTNPGEWKYISITPTAAPEVRAEVDKTLEAIAGGISKGVFPGFVEENEDRKGRYSCQYCNPDGISTIELRNQWISKSADEKLRSIAPLLEGQKRQEETATQSTEQEK